MGLSSFAVDATDFTGAADRNLNPTLGKISQDCEDAISKFVLYANRAKRAFRDAQQLVTQFKDIKSLGNLLSGDLCQQIGVVASDVPFFPAATSAPHEPVEITINRFIDFYQGPGSGQLDQLKKVAGALSGVSAALENALHVEARASLRAEHAQVFAPRLGRSETSRRSAQTASRSSRARGSCQPGVNGRQLEVGEGVLSFELHWLRGPATSISCP